MAEMEESKGRGSNEHGNKGKEVEEKEAERQMLLSADAKVSQGAQREHGRPEGRQEGNQAEGSMIEECGLSQV